MNFTEYDTASDQHGLVDSLDDMQPYPDRGKFFAEIVVREEMQTSTGLTLVGESSDDAEADARPKRARILQLGAPPEGGWDVAVGDHVIVAYHAGNHFRWMPVPGVDEHLWIIDRQECLAIFKPR